MRILLFTLFGLISSNMFSQTYCTPAFLSGCAAGDQIDSFEIPGASFSHLNTGCSNNAYGDFTSQSINVNAGVSYSFSISHGYGSQHVKIWIDYNNDGVFTDAAPELVATASSITQGGLYTTNGDISILSTVSPGTYRMRVADRFNTEPDPCNADGYGEAHDYTVVVGAAPSCLAPTDLSISAVAAYTSNLSWTASSSIPGVGYEYYLSTSMTPPLSTAVATGAVVNPNTSTPLSNLSPSTAYYVWVRSVCSATSKSAWSAVSSFKTLCGVITPDFTFDFAGGINDCWQEADAGTPASTPSGASSNWYETGFLNNGFDGALGINIYTSSWFPETFDSWVITPGFNLSAGGYRVKFDYGLTEYGDTASGSLGSDDVVQFIVSQDGGTTWTVLQTWTASSNVSNNSTQYSYDLTSYTGANTKFGFYATNGAVADAEDVEFFIDNFVIEQLTLSTNETAIKKDNIKAYPNPFADVLNISDVSNVKSISVMDVAGRVVKTFDKTESTLHLGGLNAGMYLVVLNMKDGSKQMIKAIKK
ncbi:Fibronectin type III domain protein [Chryseobacterium sp. MOF25P]|uniref:GEVED domain-containing protein n=1 Tax=unclassified Chryseobacterium TaxID=2593645 RepID=UPI000804D052|nr:MULTISPECIES: GEVED domain-containing protein [unclassified Chryseobacterium]OBW39971.1 Fibronectin type III domain protein [Chryseobacterium sp. MOF25P]OBW45193.1 Fibronectin type III domain protein [Chryseobacterium sp. BGARF1]